MNPPRAQRRDANTPPPRDFSFFSLDGLRETVNTLRLAEKRYERFFDYEREIVLIEDEIARRRLP
jgi:hypothetical protein